MLKPKWIRELPFVFKPREIGDTQFQKKTHYPKEGGNLAEHHHSPRLRTITDHDNVQQISFNHKTQMVFCFVWVVRGEYALTKRTLTALGRTSRPLNKTASPNATAVLSQRSTAVSTTIPINWEVRELGVFRRAIRSTHAARVRPLLLCVNARF